MSDPIWVIMPVLAGPVMTEAALADILAQSVPTRLLVINQGVDDAFRDRLERIAEEHDDRVLLWSHEPTLPSLSATWNRALDAVWEAGGLEALVVNNDVRLHAQTVHALSSIRDLGQALFVSAVGVREDQFDPLIDHGASPEPIRKGGPDFSCFLIAKPCHDRFRFDERFIPAHCEDLDYHRRLMLAGEGQRIFSVNLPYLHLAAGTLTHADPAVADRIRRQTESISRVYYREKWGGDVNHETFFNPFDHGVEGITTAGLPNPPTTAALFDQERAKWLASPSTN